MPLNVPSVARRPTWRARITAIPLFLQLAKARLSSLVAATAATGFVLGAGNNLELSGLTWTVLGTLLTACGANALNEWFEAPRDARMRRTVGRPLPSGRLQSTPALAFALTAAAAGPLLLALRVNLAAAACASAALLIYVLLYTPLKAHTPLNTLVGAVVGALGPMVGWAGATGRLDGGAWVLGAILLVWQIPHFLSLAWLYREDYRRGGFRMLARSDPDGHLTGCLVVVYTLALVPLTLLLTLIGVTGWAYAAGALLLGTGFVLAGAALERSRSAAAARRLFLASVIYLPLLLGLMVLGRVP
jgi:protoheme IX farnesyltransferase